MSDTPRVDEIALRLTGRTGLFCDDESLSQYNDLVRLARDLERELGAANRSADACLREIDRLRHDVARGMANHNADLNAPSPEARQSALADELDKPDIHIIRWTDVDRYVYASSLRQRVIDALRSCQPQIERSK